MAAIVAFVDIYKCKERTSTEVNYKNLVKSITFKSAFNFPEHDRPSPVHPSLHGHLREPFVLAQLAFTSQTWLLLLHSSMSTKATDFQEVNYKRIQSL